MKEKGASVSLFRYKLSTIFVGRRAYAATDRLFKEAFSKNTFYRFFTLQRQTGSVSLLLAADIVNHDIKGSTNDAEKMPSSPTLTAPAAKKVE